MRHQRSKKRLIQKPGHARMMLRNLVTSLLLYERVRTTKKRAQVVRSAVDRLLTYAKKHPPVLAVRELNRVVTDRNASRKVMEVFVVRYKDRPSGLTRMTPVGARMGDGAKVVDIEMIGFEAGPQKREAPKRSKTPTK